MKKVEKKIKKITEKGKTTFRENIPGKDLNVDFDYQINQKETKPKKK